ncbi:MAG: hypothetical protein ABIF82_05990 [Planctomycetota bacterium]
MTAWQTSRRRRSTRGSAAVMAAAIIVIAGFLGMALMASVRVRGAASTNPVLAMQAYYIADAGTEWASMTDSATDGPVSFASGSFEVTADGDAWVTVAGAADTKRTINCEPVDAETPLAADLDYVLGSREEDDDQAKFLLMNNTGSDVTFTRMKVTWSSPTAYFERLKLKVEQGQDYHDIWKHDEDPAGRWGSGETRDLTGVSSVTIPAHYTGTFELEKFEESRSGGHKVDMANTQFTFDFYNGSTPVGQVVVDIPPQP